MGVCHQRHLRESSGFEAPAFATTFNLPHKGPLGGGSPSHAGLRLSGRNPVFLAGANKSAFLFKGKRPGRNDHEKRKRSLSESGFGDRPSNRGGRALAAGEGFAVLGRPLQSGALDRGVGVSAPRGRGGLCVRPLPGRIPPGAHLPHVLVRRRLRHLGGRARARFSHPPFQTQEGRMR